MNKQFNIKTTRLSKLLNEPVKNGYSPVCTDKPTSRKILGLGALTGSGLNLNEFKWLPEDNKKIDRFILRNNDFLVSRSNTVDKVGRAALFKSTSTNFYYPDLMMKFRVNEEKILPGFLELYLQSDFAHKHFMCRASGTSKSMVKITKPTVESLDIPLFSLNEQKEIFNIIGLWTDVIEKTEALIAATEQQFEWLLYSLIKEKSAIAGWKIGSLQTIAKVKKGEQLNRSELEKQGDYPAWNGGMNPSGYTDVWNTDENTITISEGGNSCGYINYSREKFWCGGHCYAIAELSSEIDSKFLYFFLKSNEKSIMRLRVGSGLPNIQKKDIDKVEIKYPPLKQQKSIAKILNVAQQEINLLKQLAEKYRIQKRGLMQKLLTGHWDVREVEK